MSERTLDEHAEAVERSAEVAAQHHPGRTAPWRSILDAYEAERDARVDAAKARDHLAAALARFESDGRERDARLAAAEQLARSRLSDVDAVAADPAAPVVIVHAVAR